MKKARLPKAVPLLVGCVAMLNPVTHTPNPRSNSASSSLISSLTPFQIQTGGRASLRLIAGDPIIRGANEGDTDASVKPGDDFYRYANGGWAARVAITAGRQGYDTGVMLAESTRERVRSLIQDAAAAHPANGSVAQKVGDYFASYMDENSIEGRGLARLAGEMATIAAIGNKTSLSAYLGSTLNREVDTLTANVDHVLGLWVNQGFEEAERAPMASGLGLPDHDNYLGASPRGVELRAKYQAHVAAILKLAGCANSETRAARIVSLETRLARTFAPDSFATDVFKQNNPWKRHDFDVKAPGMDWEAYFKSAGLAKQSDFVVWQPSAVSGVSALVDSQGIEEWKDYLRLHLVEHYASVLPKAVNAEHFSFYGTALTGAKQARGSSALTLAGGPQPHPSRSSSRARRDRQRSHEVLDAPRLGQDRRRQ
jgi:predicted metalloendopeptidase